MLAQLCLKVLSFAELLNACLDLLKDPSFTKFTSSTPTVTLRSQSKDVQLPATVMEISLFELLHCCMQCLPSTEIRSAWAALNVLFSEVNPTTIYPRSCFLMFTQVSMHQINISHNFSILSDFVKLCGAQTIIEDRSISRGCQEASQRITEALNQIVGWQLESTTWLKRTLVVKQDSKLVYPIFHVDFSSRSEAVRYFSDNGLPTSSKFSCFRSKLHQRISVLVGNRIYTSIYRKRSRYKPNIRIDCSIVYHDKRLEEVRLIILKCSFELEGFEQQPKRPCEQHPSSVFASRG